jgi:hypothetical protein
MPIRLRHIVPLLLVALASALVAACGSSSSSGSGESVDQLLHDTFSGGKQVKSGKVDLTVRATSSGQSGGPFAVHLTGPFQSQGQGKLPKFSLSASLQGSGRSFQAGATSTGAKGYVSFQGANYVLSDSVFSQFRSGYEQAQSSNRNRGGASLATLGVDPRRWLKDARKAGETKVGDADTIEITGGVDVPRLLADLESALQRARSLGLQGSQRIPQLTPAEKQQAEQAVKSLKVDIFTGKDDHVLRRMAIDATLASGGQTSTLRFDVSLLNVNQPQAIAAPANPKPFSQLAAGLGALGLGGSSSSGSGSSAPPSGSSGGNANLQKYTQCVQKAGSNVAKAQKCASLLTP